MPVAFDGDGGELLARVHDLPGVALLDGGPSDGSVTLLGVGGRRRVAAVAGDPDPFSLVEDWLASFTTDPDPRWPFTGGLIGWFGYGARHWLEELPQRHDRLTRLPDVWLAEYRCVVLLDPAASEAAIALTLDPDDLSETRALEGLAREVRARLEAKDVTPSTPFISTGAVSWPDPRGHLEAIASAQAHIAAGDIYQVNLAQCASVARPRDLLAFYRRLRERNPAAFGGYLPVDGEVLLSISPERFLRLDGRTVETRPIKGTAPRRMDPADDREEAERLQASEKDRAELAMIVDVLRNDLSRVCQPGSVKVSDAMMLESHPTVHHLVATVRGELEREFGAVDLLRATLPGGSITGAPRIRAMEIIDALESVDRGLYTGSMGYLGYDGRMDLNILIRSAVTAGDRMYFHGGGGIVADSEPSSEYDETRHKLRAFVEVLEGDDGRS